MHTLIHFSLFVEATFFSHLSEEIRNGRKKKSGSWSCLSRGWERAGLFSMALACWKLQLDLTISPVNWGIEDGNKQKKRNKRAKSQVNLNQAIWTHDRLGCLTAQQKPRCRSWYVLLQICRFVCENAECVFSFRTYLRRNRTGRACMWAPLIPSSVCCSRRKSVFTSAVWSVAARGEVLRFRGPFACGLRVNLSA